MYLWRGSHGTVGLAFTDRAGGASAPPWDELNLALDGADDPAVTAANLATVTADFAPGARVADMRQVHGADVALGTADARPTCDALISGETDLVLVVRVADCVPVLLADPDAGVVGAVHAGRPGVEAGVVPVAIDRMRDAGARTVHAWIGPHVCGGCYEVPAALRDQVASAVPATAASTTWGTPSLDLGAGVRSQLGAAGVREDHVTEVAGCTRERDDLYSYRRDGAGAGRFAGLIVRRAEAA